MLGALSNTFKIPLNGHKFLQRRKNMKRLSMVILLVSLISSNAFAETLFSWDPNQVGDWNDATKWLDANSNPAGSAPDGTGQIMIKSGSQCTLSTDAGDWADAQRLRVYGNANLTVVNGGKLLGVSWMRIGTAQGLGKMNQTGGVVRLKRGNDNAKLYIGDAKGSQGSTYTMSGGTLTHLDGEGALCIGYRGGEGKFTVVGTDPKIQMRKLFVGGAITDKVTRGTLDFKIGSGGVSPIKLSNVIHLSRDGRRPKANLIVSATAAPPKTNIVLIENTSSNNIRGTFDTVNGNAAPEGAPVVLSHSGTDYHYKLTYQYDTRGDGNKNDIALIYAPEPAKSSGN